MKQKKNNADNTLIDVDEIIISIITVVYNGEKTLENTIRSVKFQSYKNIEYIIIDGNSKDKTIDILRKYSDFIAYWKSEDDNGIYDAMNKGLSVANGDFVLFLGADDMLFSPYTIQNIVPYMIKDVVYYGDVFLDNNRVVYDYDFNKLKLCNRNICHQSIFYPKSIYKTFKYNTEYKIYADWEYNIRVFNIGKPTYLPVVVSIYCENGSSINKDYIFIEKKKEIIIHNFGFFIYLCHLLQKPFAHIYYAISHLYKSYKYKIK